MSPVWRPLEAPPCLDQFCHLSHDAQRVMVSIYEDFNARKRELLQSLHVVERQSEGTNYIPGQHAHSRTAVRVSRRETVLHAQILS